MPIHNEILEAGQSVLIVVHHSDSHELRMGTLITEVECIIPDIFYWSLEYGDGIVDTCRFSQYASEFGSMWEMENEL